MAMADQIKKVGDNTVTADALGARRFEYATLGQVFRAVMEREGIPTFEELGSAIDVSDVTVGRVCKDEQLTMKPENLEIFARRFHVPLEPLLLLNSIHSLPAKVKAKVSIPQSFFEILLDETEADPRMLAVFSDITLPYSVWAQGKKKKMTAAQILAEHVTEESGSRDVSERFTAGSSFIFRFSGSHMLSTNPGAKVIPPGAFLLIREMDESELVNGDLVLVQLLPSGRQKTSDAAQVYIYNRRVKSGYVYETYISSNPDPVNPARVRHSGKFGEKDLRESRIIYGKVIRIVDHRY